MIRISLTVIAASAAAFWSNQLPDSYWYSYIPLLLMLALVKGRFQLLLIFATVFLWASFQLALQRQQGLTDAFDGEVVELSGRIVDIVEQRKNSIRFLLEVDEIQGYTQTLPDKIRLSWYRSSLLPQPGERWHLQAKLRQPSGFQNPGGFDYERWLFVNGIGATGYVKKSVLNRKLDDAPWWQIDTYRQAVLAALKRDCSTCQYLGLFQALSIGYRGSIEAEHYNLLKDSATAHLLAISGLHIGLVAALFLLLGRWLWSAWFFRFALNRIEFSAALSMTAAIVYAALAGFSIPTVRALVMLGVVIGSIFLRRDINLLNSIAVAVLLILLIDPLAVGSTSFWLSVSALLIIAFGQLLLAGQSSRVKQMLIIQLLFSVLFMPLSLLLFGQLSPVGFLANVVAIPVISLVILPAVLVVTLCAVFNLPGAERLFAIVDSLMGWLMAYLQSVLQLSTGAYENSQTPVLLLICAGIGLFSLLLPVNNNIRKPALILLVLALIWRPEKIPQGDYRLTVLDVGMGTSVVVETRHHSLIYDFGPGNDSGFSAGDWVVKPYLRHRGIASVDLMVISHVDQDHSGGFISFIDQLDYTRLVSGTPTALVERFNLEKPVRNCHDMRGWQWDGVVFEFLNAGFNEGDAATNNRSCVLSITAAQTTLLSGDIEAEQESRLLASLPHKIKADILLAPHHGSLTSSTEEFVRQVAPGIVIFTLGRGNRWGFPRPEVVRRYQQIGSQIYRSDQHGAVTLTTRGGTSEVDSYRQNNRRLW